MEAVNKAAKKAAKKAVIVAPFWHQTGHVGNYRVDRFIRWLATAGYFVVVVRAGSVSDRRTTPWGMELTVRDTLGLYRHNVDSAVPIPPRRPNRLRRWVATTLFNPDPGIVWSRTAASNRDVLHAGAGAAFVISSSPPESAHVGAARLARSLNAKFVLDMRDGWLDEPLKPLLRSSRIRRWIEGSLEKSLLRQAHRIFVTSTGWKRMLEERVPSVGEKVAVLTNGYPPHGSSASHDKVARSSTAPLRLIHAGRFTGSRLTQKPGFLLEPLSMGLDGGDAGGIVTLLGDLEGADLDEVRQWQPVFESKKWTIEVRSAVPRDEMMLILGQADGLLLLSASQAAIPSKLFEYLPLGKPVFATTPLSSALWQMSETIDQLFVTDYAEPDRSVARQFIAVCESSDADYDIPQQFAEDALSKRFLREIGAG